MIAILAVIRGCCVFSSTSNDSNTSSNTWLLCVQYPPANGEVLVVMRYKREMDRRIRNCIIRMKGRIHQPGTEGRCLGLANKVRDTLHGTGLHCTAHHYAAMHHTHRTAPHTTMLHCISPTALHHTTLHYTTLQYAALHHTPPHYAVLHHTPLHYTTPCCTTPHPTIPHHATLYHATPHQTTPHHTMSDHTMSDHLVSGYNTCSPYIISRVVVNTHTRSPHP